MKRCDLDDVLLLPAPAFAVDDIAKTMLDMLGMRFLFVEKGKASAGRKLLKRKDAMKRGTLVIIVIKIVPAMLLATREGALRNAFHLISLEYQEKK